MQPGAVGDLPGDRLQPQACPTVSLGMRDTATATHTLGQGGEALGLLGEVRHVHQFEERRRTALAEGMRESSRPVR